MRDGLMSESDLMKTVEKKVQSYSKRDSSLEELRAESKKVREQITKVIKKPIKQPPVSE
jgi:hypothetical protein